MRFSVATIVLFLIWCACADVCSAAAASAAEKYKVSTKLADIPFDITPSHAGLMPLDGRDPKDGQYFFWLFDSEVAEGKDDIILWMNGGPSCSSMEGALQAGSPISIPYNKKDPDLNQYRWTQLANVVFVDQPFGVGFSTGKSELRNEVELAQAFYAFLVSFFKTFTNLRGKKLYFAGQSYAGVMQANIIMGILNHTAAENAANGINYQGWTIFSPALSNDYCLYTLATTQWALDERQTLSLNDSFIKYLSDLGDKYGLKDYYKDNLVYPPKGPMSIPTKNNWTYDEFDPYALIVNATSLANKCYSIYDISTRCPFPKDPLGFGPGDEKALAKNWINEHPNFKKALNVDPGTQWLECGTPGDVFPFGGYPKTFPDPGPMPYEHGILGRIIDNSPSKRVVVAHGMYDARYIAMGNELSLQNTTWGGYLGFQTKPSHLMRAAKLPLVPSAPPGKTFGKIHTERGLTFLLSPDTGHRFSSDQPTAVYQLLAYQLGRLTFDDIAQKM